MVLKENQIFPKSSPGLQRTAIVMTQCVYLQISQLHVSEFHLVILKYCLKYKSHVLLDTKNLILLHTHQCIHYHYFLNI